MIINLLAIQSFEKDFDLIPENFGVQQSSSFENSRDEIDAQIVQLLKVPFLPDLSR